jgi:hypothetical protein
MADVARRTALLGGAGALGVVALGVRLQDTEAPRGRTSPARPATVPAHAQLLLRSHFTAAVGAPVLARHSTAAHRLKLVSIADVQGARSAERQFNLLFEAIGRGGPAEGIYEVTGARIPDTTLFLSPVGTGRNRRLQALVNSPT